VFVDADVDVAPFVLQVVAELGFFQGADDGDLGFGRLDCGGRLGQGFDQIFTLGQARQDGAA
jgi:hypothetical protein